MSRFRLTTLSSRLLQLRGLSQAAQQTSQRNPIAALSDYHAALRRSQIAHRQSTKWRTPSTSAKPSTKPNTPPVTESRSARLIVSYHDLERALQARGLNTARVFFMSAAAVAIAVGFSWPKIKKWGAVEGAEVAAASLEREELQMKASAMLQEVLKDPKTAEQVEGMLRGVVTNMLEDKEFYDRMVTWTAAVFKDMLTWDEVRAAGTAYVTSVLEDPQSKKSAEEYLAQSVQKVAADEVVQDSVASGLWTTVRTSIMGRWKPRQAKESNDNAQTASQVFAAAAEGQGDNAKVGSQDVKNRPGLNASAAKEQGDSEATDENRKA